jgi:VanZ family protein
MSASTETAVFVRPPSRHRLSRYGPLVLWALLIFVASTNLFSASNTSRLVTPLLQWLFPHISRATVDFIHGVVIRKGAHLTEYALFALLAARAFRTSSHDLVWRHWFLASVLLVVAYSLGDEFHQSFVPSRTASVYDSTIDSFGGLLALTLVAVRRSRRPASARQS